MFEELTENLLETPLVTNGRLFILIVAFLAQLGGSVLYYLLFLLSEKSKA